jgi:hypothetical protein
MDGKFIKQFSGKPEDKCLMVMQDDLHKDIKVLYETENMANIIDENRQGWVPKNCIVIDDIPAYCGNLSKHEAEEKLALAPDNACLLYTEKRKTGNFVLAVMSGQVHHRNILRRQGTNNFYFMNKWYTSINLLAQSIILYDKEINLFKMSETTTKTIVEKKKKPAEPNVPAEPAEPATCGCSLWLLPVDHAPLCTLCQASLQPVRCKCQGQGYKVVSGVCQQTLSGVCQLTVAGRRSRLNEKIKYC